MWQAILYLIFSYLIGAIPTAYLIAKKLRGIDIREHGSGNVGSTNLKRVVGSKAGAACMAIDCLKGLIAVVGANLLFTQHLDPYHVVPVFAAVAAVLGHSKSVFIGFSGGKSVNTSLGVILALEPIVGLIIAAIAFSTIYLTRYVSLGSILGAICLPIMVWVFHGPVSHIVATSLMTIYVIYLHRSNIGRLIRHQENRI